MNSVRRITLTAAIALVALALVACGPGSPDDAGTTPSTPPSVAPTAEPTTSATPSPEPTTAAEPLTCENIVPQSRLDFIAAQGWTLFAPADFFAKLRSDGFDHPQLRFEDNGGIVCPWATGDHVVYAYGYSPLPADQVAAARSQVLASDPYVESSFAGAPLFTSEIAENPFTLYWIDNAGSWYLATEERLLDELRRQNP